MDGLTNGQKKGRRTDGQMNPWTDKQLYGHTECRKKRRKDRRMSRGKDRQ